MFRKHRLYYTIEVRDVEDSYSFLYSYSTYSEAIQKLEELKCNSDREYRILKIEKYIEEVS